MKTIGGYDFPNGTTSRASEYQQIGPDGELVPLAGWEFSVPGVSKCMIVPHEATIEAAAKIVHEYLEKRGLLEIEISV